MKKFLATSAVAAFVATTVSAAAPCGGSMTGFYIGGNMGYGIGSAKTNSSLISNAVPAATIDTARNDLAFSGMLGGLMAGYQKDFGKFVAGLEAHANLAGMSGKFGNTSQAVAGGPLTGFLTVSVKKRSSFGLSAKLGYKINSWLTYVKLGWDAAQFKATQTYNNNFGVATAGRTALSKKKTLNGFAAGLGMETMITDNVFFGGEWTYTFYGKKNFGTHFERNAAGAVHTGSLSVRPRTNEFKLRLGYKF